MSSLWVPVWVVLNQDSNLTADLQNSTDWCSHLLDCKIFCLELLLWVIQISNFSNRNMLDDVEVTWALLNCVFVRHLETFHLGSVFSSRKHDLWPDIMNVFALAGNAFLVNGVHWRTALRVWCELCPSCPLCSLTERTHSSWMHLLAGTLLCPSYSGFSVVSGYSA